MIIMKSVEHGTGWQSAKGYGAVPQTTYNVRNNEVTVLMAAELHTGGENDDVCFVQCLGHAL